jgi:DNA-binding response OmpR family regulator
MKRVVIADDDGELRRLLAQTLARAGVEVAEIGDGQALLRLVEGTVADGAPRPDAIIADVQMPGCTGFRVLACMRRLGVGVPFILITAFGDAASHALARRLGAAAMFDKPFDLHELQRCVMRVMHA